MSSASTVFPMLCSWCGVVTGHVAVEHSHGICRPCFEQLTGIPLLSEPELAGLPIGVIELDATGTILRYNAAEEALSGRESLAVLGRNFFRDIAPCTAVADFQGRFSAFIASVSEPESFSFEFPFPSRTEHVTIAFVRSGPSRAFVLVRSRSEALATA